MKDLSLKAVVTSPSGFFYREEHEWRGLDPAASDWFTRTLAKIDAHLAGIKTGTGDLTATLEATVDGQSHAQTVNGFGRSDLVTYQKMWQKVGDDLVEFGDKHAKAHKATHQKP